MPARKLVHRTNERYCNLRLRTRRVPLHAGLPVSAQRSRAEMREVSGSAMLLNLKLTVQ